MTSQGYTPFIIALVALTTIAGTGLNILTGLTGQVSFGHVGFYAIGAYTVGVLTLQGVSLWLALVLAGLSSALTGFLLALPALRVSGPYLGMMTIAFAFIVEHVTIEWRQVTGGQNGLLGIPQPDFGAGLTGEKAIGLIAVLIAGLSLALFQTLARGRWGKAMVAVRDSETASAGIGLSITHVKTLAFALSALLTGLAGGCFAVLLAFIAPSAFPFSQSILFLLSVIVGGAGWMLGPLVGAGITIVLPELISAFAEYRLLIFAVLLLVVLWLAPEGIIGALAKLFPVKRLGPPQAGAFSINDFLRQPRHHIGLDVRKLSIAFGGIHAAQEISFLAPCSRITGLIGPNGAGKTTVLNLVSGFYRPDQGEIIVNGRDLAGEPVERLAREGIARTYQTTQLFASLDVLDNVLMGMRRGRLGVPWAPFASPQERRAAEGLLSFVGYRGDLAAPASGLAHIDRRLVEIARALASSPTVLLLDEPAAGLSASDKAHMADILRTLAKAGLAVILVEHDMALVMEVSDHIIVLDAGRMIAEGHPAGIRDDKRVRAAYLGGHSREFSARPIPLPHEAPVVLDVQNLSAGYGPLSVLNDISFTIREGEMVTILGANGAGKSTTMRALTGLNPARSGVLNFLGQPLQSMAAHLIARSHLVLVPEGRQVFPEMSVIDNLRLGAHGRSGPQVEIDIAALLKRFPRLSERLQGRAGLLSGGEAQMLAVARALMAKPRLLLLDEPSLGLAPKIVEDLYAMLGELRDEGMTLLLVDQMAGLALQLADRGYVMASGAIIQSGSAAQLRNDPLLEGAYLGHRPQAVTMARGDDG